MTTKVSFDITLDPRLLKEVQATVDGETVKYHTYPGVFSYRKTDIGTRLLAEHLPPEISPIKIIDLGCGSGILSLLAATKYPYAEIHGVDIDPRAVALSQLNFDPNPRITAWGSNLFEQVPDYDYDLVITNIPAKPTKEVHMQLVEQSFNHMKSGGQIYIVAAGRLSKYLIRLLEGKFADPQKQARNKTHTVISATKQ